MLSILTVGRTEAAVGAFWNVIQIELDQERFHVPDRELARKLNVSPSTIRNWRDGLKRLPSVTNIRAVAEFSGRSYEDVLMIALSETGHARGTRLARRTTVADLVERDLSPRRSLKDQGGGPEQVDTPEEVDQEHKGDIA